MAYLEFDEFPDLIKYSTTIGNGTLLKEEYTTFEEYTLLKDIEHFLYLTQSYFSDNTPNQILHMMSTLQLFRKHSTLLLVNILPYMISWEDLICWEYHLDNPNMSVNPKIFQSTLILPPMYSGEMLHHMHDSGEANNSSVCHTSHTTCPSVCQSCQLSICHTTNTTCPSICQSVILPI